MPDGERVDEVHRRMARRIRELADERALPLSHLADRAAISRTQLWDVLRGKKSPTVRWLTRIADILEVETIDLLDRIGGRYASVPTPVSRAAERPMRPVRRRPRR